MSNMLPQNQSMNTGDWKKLEAMERDLATDYNLHILAGGIGSKGKTPGGVNIPTHCWKAIYYDEQWHCYLIPNNKSSVGNELGNLQINKSDLNRLTGLHL